MAAVGVLHVDRDPPLTVLLNVDDDILAVFGNLVRRCFDFGGAVYVRHVVRLADHGLGGLPRETPFERVVFVVGQYPYASEYIAPIDVFQTANLVLALSGRKLNGTTGSDPTFTQLDV